MTTGFFAGVIATCFNAPFDVVKSRFQQQRIDDVDRHKSTLATLSRIYKHEGINGCYRGIQPKILRMGIGGAVSMT
eukprot:CAMPEP_0202709016 /NCGR_PEP_ID=MMETSP1385-20130828/21157_1 /ASSEMBLY_ACC=CAM_ASM_000861 /TAXON_ID=933848 /ORGANISM="Elphidium margaritaceum" /LENGTH=75 /DNA_ID=CAMNT_0049368155 /DNA_START=85 /DNA_END=309 /DNA_ORIENTATION=-